MRGAMAGADGTDEETGELGESNHEEVSGSGPRPQTSQTTQKIVFSYQDRGQMGSRYIIY